MSHQVIALSPDSCSFSPLTSPDLSLQSSALPPFLLPLPANLPSSCSNIQANNDPMESLSLLHRQVEWRDNAIGDISSYPIVLQVGELFTLQWAQPICIFHWFVSMKSFARDSLLTVEGKSKCVRVMMTMTRKVKQDTKHKYS